MLKETRTKPITAADVEALHAQGVTREIINGQWVDETVAAGKKHGRIGARIIAQLLPFVEADGLGEVYQDNTTYILQGLLAIEIISPSESASMVQGKIEDYLQHGTRQVWVVYPLREVVSVHLPDGSAQTYRPPDAVPGGDLLPGFTLNLEKVFA